MHFNRVAAALITSCAALAVCPADANAALGEYRQMPDTRFLKGLILIAMGDRQAGQASIAEAKVMKPSVERQYAVWGLTP